MDPSSPRSPLDDGEIGDDESKEFDDGYDENLMGDEEDKKKLAQMTEKEREQELFNRSERRETLKIRFEIARKLKSKAEKREQEKKQSKQLRARKRLRASEIYSSDEMSEESDEYTPDVNKLGTNDVNTSGKPPTKMNTRSALLITSSSESSASSESSSSSSSDDESEPENVGLEADDDNQITQDHYQMTLADIKELQLKRHRIEKWVYAPFFKQTAVGLFVKISVGNHPQIQGTHMYKIAQIKDIVKSSKIYAIDSTIDSKTKTDKHCVVRIGSVERTYPMSFISNRPFDEDDFQKWRDQLRLDREEMPNREYFNRKKRDLHNAANYEYKDEDIKNEVEERKRFKEHPYNFALKKTELMGEKVDAEAANDYEKARRLQQEIDELEEKARALEKERSSRSFSAISIVNERNRYKNINESERVLKESKSVKTEDPFTRRKCTPTIVHNKNNGDSNSQNKNDKNGQEVSKLATHNISANSTNPNGGQKNTTKPEGVKSVDDLFQAHAGIDLSELDIDI